MVPRWFVCVALLLAVPRAASAEWHFTPTLGATFAARTTLFDLDQAADKTHKNFGGTIALLGEGIIGAEAVFVWTPGFFQRPLADPLLKESDLFSLVGNVVVTTPRRWTEYGLRPFVSGGYGVIRASSIARREDLLPVNTNFAAWNIGGGAVGFLSNRTGVRIDWRYYHTLPKDEANPPVSFGPPQLRYMTLSFGVVFRR